MSPAPFVKPYVEHLERAAGYLERIKSESSRAERERLANGALASLKSARLTLEQDDGEPPVAYYVEATYADGEQEHYPPDDYLRDTSGAEWTLITDDDEALETASSVADSVGWVSCRVYRRTSDGMSTCIGYWPCDDASAV